MSIARTHVPFMSHCRIEGEDAPPGTARVRVTVADPLTNTRGQAHGGLLMTMLDLALGRAAQSAVPGAISFATIDMHVSFIAPGSGILVGEGRVVRAGRSLVFTEGDVRDETGALVARASAIFRPILPS
jgi:uncharacterized protein (TIGR00369 family)